MTANISATAAQSQLTSFTTLVDAGAGASVLEVYSADYTTLLVSYSLSATPFGVATTPTPPAPSIATANGLPIAGTGAADGTAEAFRLKDGDGTVVIQGTGDGSVGTASAIVILTNLSIATGQAVNLTDFKLTQPTVVSIYAL